MAAFAFSRFRFQGRQAILKAILLIQVFPNLLTLVAIFLMIAEVGDIVPRFGLGHPCRVDPGLYGWCHGDEYLADEGVPRHHPA